MPTKLSSLIYHGLGDFLKCIASPRFEINMVYWVKPDDETNQCSVCLAGSVLAKTFNHQNVSALSRSIPNWARALNEVRGGNIRDALRLLGLEWPSDFSIDYDMPEFSDEPEAFINTLYQIAFELAEKDL